MFKVVTRLNNLIFWFCAVFLVFAIFSNFYSIALHATGIQSSGNTQIGARISAVSDLGCLPPPPAGDGPDPVCVVAGCPPSGTPPTTHGVTLIPFGYSATSFCAPVLMNTTQGPISIANVGFVILGLFQGVVNTGLPAVPIGIPGMAMQS